MDTNDLRAYNLLKRLKVIYLVNGILTFKDGGFSAIKKKLKNKKMKLTDGNFTEITLNSEENLQVVNFEIGKIDVVIANDVSLQNVIKILGKSEYNFIKIGDCEDCQGINLCTFNTIFLSRSFIYIYNIDKCNFDNVLNIKCSDDLNDKIENYKKSFEGLKLIANYNSKNNISVKAATFFNYVGTNYYSGGAERYLLDLHEVARKMGINLNIYQNADVNYFRKYNNVNVIGLKNEECPLNYSMKFLETQSKNYIDQSYNFTSLNIYSAFNECFPFCASPSIGISHGISWDGSNNKVVDGIDFWNNKKIFIESAMKCDKLISVDTNTANWFQTIDYNFGNQCVSVIPNYVNTNEFYPNSDYLEKKDKIIITYPRRLYEPRGLYVVLDIVEEILDKYSNVEFHFVGKGFEEDLANINIKIDKYGERIKCYSKSPFEMHEVYKKSDISLIPTLYSEGTSLSCLEALASGNIVIATRIGGLTDLVINNHNGYLIEPNCNSLKSTIFKILDNYENQEIIRENALRTANAFNINSWNESWTKEIENFNLDVKSENNDLVEFYVNDVKNISSEMTKLIKDELLIGNLIYIRSNNLKGLTNFGLIQYVLDDEEVVSTAKAIYVSECYKDIKRNDCEIKVI